MEFLVMFMVIVYAFSVALNIYLTVKWIKRYSSIFMKIIGVLLGITATFSFITMIFMILQAVPVYIPHVDYVLLVGILSITILILFDLNELQKTV
ncbi:hypothetical protein [Persephonella sp.]